MEALKIAELCHEVNRGYCASIGDFSQVSWSEAPDWQKESAVNGVTYHLTSNTTPEKSHENWLEEKRTSGWKYGEVKDVEKKTHPCFVPYAELSESQRSKDYIFKSICDFFKDMQ